MRLAGVGDALGAAEGDDGDRERKPRPDEPGLVVAGERQTIEIEGDDNRDEPHLSSATAPTDLLPAGIALTDAAGRGLVAARSGQVKHCRPPASAAVSGAAIQLCGTG